MFNRLCKSGLKKFELSQYSSHKESSSENELVRPVPARRKRLASSKARQELGAKFESKIKKARISNEMSGTILLLDDKVPPFLPVGGASDEDPSCPGRLAVL